MTAEQIIGLLLALLVMGLGVLGCLVPGLPGTPLVLAAAVGHKLWFGETGAPWWVLAMLVWLTVVALILDYLAAHFGAKKFGASRRGSLGAMAGVLFGGLIGLFLGGVGSVLGVLVGPLIGAMLMEKTHGRPWREAFRAGAGATLGLLAGALGKAFISFVMTGLFLASVLWKSLG